MSTVTAQTAPLSAAPAKKKSKRTLYIILGVALLLIVIVVAIAAKNQGEKPTGITVEKAVVRTITHLVTATGKVQPEVEVKISPEVSGEIIELPLKEGSSIKKGDLLVKIKPDFYRAQLEQQEANLVAARTVAVQSKAQLLKAQQDFKRSDDLFAKRLISDSEYTTAKTGLEVAQANYDNALAQIRRTEGSLSQFADQLSKTAIYAPMAGSISALSSEVGERVVGTGQFAGTEIMRIANLGSMEVRVKVNENDIVNVKVGDHAIVTVDAFPGRKFNGAVREISSSSLSSGAVSSQAALAASASDEVTNFLVKISITDRDAKLRPGMSATVDIETQTVANVVTVPIQSVTVRAAGGKTSEEVQKAKAKEAKERSGNDLELANEREDARRNRDALQRLVFVKSGDTVKTRPVETGLADNTYIEVKSGVKAGEEIVSGSYAAISRKLKDGAKVMIEKPKTDDKK